MECGRGAVVPILADALIVVLLVAIAFLHAGVPMPIPAPQLQLLNNHKLPPRNVPILDAYLIVLQ